MDAPFIFAVVVVTGACLLLAISGGSTAARITAILSIPPVYCLVYVKLLTLKGWLLHRNDVFKAPMIELQHPEKSWPCVAFVIVACNEPFDVAKLTFDCAYRARYKGHREIVVVDNSDHDCAADFMAWNSYVTSHVGVDSGISVAFKHNTGKPGSKAANIDLGLSLIETAEYIVFLDVDSSLPMNSEFLHEAVQNFQTNPRLGVLQFHTQPTNGHFNRLGRSVACFQGVRRSQDFMRSLGGFAMFYGHNAMWRRSLLEINGTWLELHRGRLIVTEDLLKTVNLYAKGFESQYMYVTTGEWIPTSLGALKSMWMRWTYGGFQVFAKYWPTILRSKGFDFYQRLDLSTLVLSYIACPLIFPMTLVWAAVLPAAAAGSLTLLVAFLPQLCYAGLYSLHHPTQCRSTKNLLDLYSGLFVIDIYVLIVQMRATFNFLVGRRQGWTVTSKRHEKKPNLLAGLREEKWVVLIASSAIIYLALLWIYRDTCAAGILPYYIALALMPINLLVCVIAYSDQVQDPGAIVETAIIDQLSPSHMNYRVTELRGFYAD